MYVFKKGGGLTLIDFTRLVLTPTSERCIFLGIVRVKPDGKPLIFQIDITLSQGVVKLNSDRSFLKDAKTEQIFRLKMEIDVMQNIWIYSTEKTIELSDFLVIFQKVSHTDATEAPFVILPNQTQ